MKNKNPLKALMVFDLSPVTRTEIIKISRIISEKILYILSLFLKFKKI